MNNSESGRKINQAVNTTSKAVGGALSQAKGALSNWWSSMTTPPIIESAPPKFVVQDEHEYGAVQNIGTNPIESPNENDNNAIENVCNIGIIESDDSLICHNDNKSSNATTTTTATPVKKLKNNQDGIVEIGHEAAVLNISTSGDKGKIINI